MHRAPFPATSHGNDKFCPTSANSVFVSDNCKNHSVHRELIATIAATVLDTLWCGLTGVHSVWCALDRPGQLFHQNPCLILLPKSNILSNVHGLRYRVQVHGNAYIQMPHQQFLCSTCSCSTTMTSINCLVLLSISGYFYSAFSKHLLPYAHLHNLSSSIPITPLTCQVQHPMCSASNTKVHSWLFYLPFLTLMAVLSGLAHLFMYVLHYCLHQSSTEDKFCLTIKPLTDIQSPPMQHLLPA